MNENAEIRLKLLLLVYPFFWFGGLVPFWGLLVFVLLLGDRTNAAGKIFLLFGLIQLLSTGVSVLGSWFQADRLAPMLHNVLVYFIFVFSFLTVCNYRVNHWAGIFKGAVFINFIFYILIYIYSGNVSEVSYSGVLHEVNFSRAGFIFEGGSVRISFMGFYVNTAAIISCLIFFLYFSLAFNSEKEKIWLFAAYTCSLIAVLMSGSRVVIFVMLIFPILVVFKAIAFRYLGLILAPFVVFLFFYLGVFDTINGYREGSSDTRAVIYDVSLSLMQASNLITGLGIKPYTAAVDFPLGSHSTYIGYFVKNGLIGLAFVLIYFFFILRELFKSISITSSSIPYIRWMLVLLVSVIFAFEDLDAFELNAVLFGIMLGLAYSAPKNAIN